MKKIKTKNGFTIIELAVVMAVFLLVIGAGITIFISIVKSQKRILAEQEFLNQISYAQEYMSKAIRMAGTDVSGSCLEEPGDIYLLTRQDTSTGFYRGIIFINQTNDSCQEFFFEEGVLKESKDGAGAVDLTSGDLGIESVRFIVNGATNEDEIQPRVTILLKIKIASEDQTRSIQTTVSRRNLNVQ